METIKGLLLIVIILLSLAASIDYILELNFLSNIPLVSESEERSMVVFGEANYTNIELKVPAVDNEGNGIVTKLIVQARPGEGRVLTDINQLFFWVDTQNSIRVAQRVAQNITNINISKVDLIYGIETDAQLIEGPSAGAALTVATIAALENKNINPDVMITGTIKSDGSIGAVGEVAVKAKAAEDVGTKIFLVPKGQSTYTYYEPVTECKEYGIPGFYKKYCTTEYKPVYLDLNENSTISVIEVFNINEALQYFLS